MVGSLKLHKHIHVDYFMLVSEISASFKKQNPPPPKELLLIIVIPVAELPQYTTTNTVSY